MKWAILSVASAVILLITVVTSCVHQPSPIPADGNFPPDIANILVNKCAVSGCHNAASYTNADKLLLDSWDHLFNGGVTGAVVVPYSPQYSPLLYFVNTDSSLGPVAVPTMPYSTPGRVLHPLTKAEYLLLESWIASGAPDKDGNVAFASNPSTRQKIYLTQQGCDLVGVIDAERNVVMRYIPVGMSATSIESPHCVRVSSDGMYAYVSFYSGDYIQKIDTRTDQVVGSAYMGPGAWNIIYLSPQDTSLLASDWQGAGYVGFVQTVGMTPAPLIGGSSTFVYPHGITSNATYDTFFITAQYGNVIYKLSASALYYKQISIDGHPPSAALSATGATPDPHEVLMKFDHSAYFVTCEGSNQVKLMDAYRDSVLATIPVGVFPVEMAMSTTKPYLFVTCQEDSSTISGRRGSVYVINYNTLQVVTVLYGDFYQPHGITVDDKTGLVYIASTNANVTGPAPHHVTACSGRPGWYTVYNLNTLQPLNNNRYEVTVMPYSAAVRFR